MKDSVLLLNEVPSTDRLPNALLDSCVWMDCLAKEEANPVNPFLFDLNSGWRAIENKLKIKTNRI